jgi:uncharacterized protein YndB with AHSA1/START domain
MTAERRGPAVIEFPNELEIVITREFAAPRQLVFDVMTKPEHVRKTMAPFSERPKVCEIDLRVGGRYHFVFVTESGFECSFRGTYLEVEPPIRTVQTWLFEGWPDAEAVETNELHEIDGVTTLTYKMAFRDKAGRARMTKFDGPEANLDHMETLLLSLLDRSPSH